MACEYCEVATLTCFHTVYGHVCPVGAQELSTAVGTDRLPCTERLADSCSRLSPLLGPKMTQSYLSVN